MAQTAHMETNVAGRRNDVKPHARFLFALQIYILRT